MFEMNSTNPRTILPIITSHHGLSLLSATQSDEHCPCEQVYATSLSKKRFALESFHGAFFRTQLDPRTSRIKLEMLICQPGQAQGWLNLDVFNLDHYEFCKERMSSIKDRNKIDALVKANQLCCEAAKFEALPLRMKKIREAQAVCPEHCPLLYIMMFEIETMKLMNSGADDIGKGGLVESALRKAVSAGRELVTLIKANEFAKGTLYALEPTRNYIRGIYLLGSFLLYQGKRKEAFDCFQECLANDLDDCLGSRHKQVVCVLEGKLGLHDERLKDLLRAKFGDDQMKDELFALWNYTRALVAFAKGGNSEKSRRLLNHALDKNILVPPLLLCWDSTKTDMGMNTLISIGHDTEANDYAIDNRRFWAECEGALQWLEEEYVNHSKAIVPKINEQGRKLLSEGNNLLNSEAQKETNSKRTKRLTKAIRKFGELLNIADSDDRFSLVRLDALEKLGVCFKSLDDPKKALTFFNRALECQTLLRNEKDRHKELLYQSASCKEELEDYDGALQDYKRVFDNIGPFSTAYEGVKRIEGKIGRKSSAIPSRLERKIPAPSPESLAENARLAELSRYALGVGNPNDSVAAKQERCFDCNRGGMKLKQCALCKTDPVSYCSKKCQKKSWRSIHKYLCTGSKDRLEEGCQVILEGLQKAPQYNWNKGKVLKYSNAKERFVIELSETKTQLLLKPENLKLDVSD